MTNLKNLNFQNSFARLKIEKSFEMLIIFRSQAIELISCHSLAFFTLISMATYCLPLQDQPFSFAQDVLWRMEGELF